MMAKASDDRRRLAGTLDSLGRRLSATVWGGPAKENLVGLEGEVGGALHRVEPSDRFRESLRQSLTVAAERKASGLVIEQPRGYGEALLLGLVGGLLATLILGVLMWAHARVSEEGAP